MLITKHTSEIIEPVNKYQNKNLELKFDNDFDSDDEVMLFIFKTKLFNSLNICCIFLFFTYLF